MDRTWPSPCMRSKNTNKVTWFFKVTELDHLVGSDTNKPPTGSSKKTFKFGHVLKKLVTTDLLSTVTWVPKSILKRKIRGVSLRITYN